MTLEEVLTSGLVGIGDLDPDVLELVSENVLKKADFTDQPFLASDLVDAELASLAELESEDLVTGGNVQLHALVESRLISLEQLVEDGFLWTTQT